MRCFAVCFGILLFALVTPVFAQDATSDFTISVFAGEDTEPPTTPTLLSITPTSPTQIDITWSVATDNFVLSGYIVERRIGSSSTSTIATTTLTSFSDTGLTPTTTYTYSVRAFDSVGNYSTSSNSLSTTTPAIPVTPPTPPSDPSEQTVARVVADEVLITPDVTSADFSITTPFPSRFEIRWGRTTSYELGFIASDILRRNYQTIITGLEPGTRYQYEIIGYTPFGQSNLVAEGQFRTLNDFDLTAPANVRRFVAEASGDDVELSWELPDDNDIAFVRIVRSHLGYPISPTDGAVVYQGTGGSAVDIGVLARYSPAYYTAFVYDESGNISSGAIAIAFAASDVPSGSAISGEGNTGTGTFVPPLEPLASTSQRMPDAFDILIKQNNLEYSFGDRQATLDNEEPFLIYLDAKAVTSNLKSIIVNLQDPTDQRRSFSFLLRLNKEQTAYEAVIAPLQVVGKSSLVLSVYDFRALRVAEYRMELLFEDLAEEVTAEDIRAGDVQLLWQFLLAIVLLLLLVIWWLIAKDRDDDEDNEDAEVRQKRYSTISKLK